MQHMSLMCDSLCSASSYAFCMNEMKQKVTACIAKPSFAALLVIKHCRVPMIIRSVYCVWIKVERFMQNILLCHTWNMIC